MASLSLHVKVLFGKRTTIHVNAACKMAADEKDNALRLGGHCECRFFTY